MTLEFDAEVVIKVVTRSRAYCTKLKRNLHLTTIRQDIRRYHSESHKCDIRKTECSFFMFCSE